MSIRPSTQCSPNSPSGSGSWRALVPPDPTPRIGAGGEKQRVYLDHAFDVGAYNPCFPEYTFDHLDDETASGRVTFPVVYEGPPGLVNGGFLAVFFDCITQHQSCAARRTGKTRSLTVTFRRPTPILTELRFDVARSEDDGQGHVDSAAAVGRRGALHRRVQDGGVSHRTN